MVNVVTQLLTAFGLASASGLNAYIPLLVVALAARFTPWLRLSAPYDILTHDWVIGALAVLLAIEVVVDKIPAADSLNDVFQTLVRPTAGAVLFAASTSVIQLEPVIAVILGLVLAFGVHAVKATARPVVTATTGGLGNAAVSVGEDTLSLGLAVTAIVAPLLAGLAFGLVLLLIGRWYLRRRHAPPAGREVSS